MPVVGGIYEYGAESDIGRDGESRTVDVSDAEIEGEPEVGLQAKIKGIEVDDHIVASEVEIEAVDTSQEETAEQVSIELSCDDFMAVQDISQEMEVYVGDSFIVTLCSNPTTGFQWSETAQVSDQTVLEQVDHKLVSPESEPPPPPGTPGQEIWTFEALKTGTSTISMEYSQPWEGGEKEEWTFELTIVVK